MIDLNDDQILQLPVDQLGLWVLRDFDRTGGWNRHNYINEANNAGFSQDKQRILSEAFSWLMARVMIAPEQNKSGDSIFLTRTGKLVAAEGPDAFYATERLQRNLHPKIEAKARPQFLIGEYEQGVFVAMKAVEVRVRKLCKLGDEVTGVDLMNAAWKKKDGILTDKAAVAGEQEGVRSLFAGAYMVFRNPAGHREVDYDDVVEAAEMVQTASLLMRIVDRAEKRQRDARDAVKRAEFSGRG